MPLMTWSDALSVGVGKFDEQHKKLVGMLNELHAAMSEGRGNEVLGRVLDGLVAYTASHFADEEQVMQQYAFPGLAQHKLQHAELVREVLELQGRFKAGRSLLTVEVMNFLKSWLSNHIQGSDRAYGDHLRLRGAL